MEWWNHWNTGIVESLFHTSSEYKAYVYSDTAQTVLVLKSHEWAIKAIQLDRLSSGMREVVGKAARVKHIVGKTLGMTASSFAPVQYRRRHYS